MDEATWLASEDVAAMLEFARNPAHAGIAGQPYITPRKLRLFACAWWRSLLPHTSENEILALSVEERGECLDNLNREVVDAEELIRLCLRYTPDNAGPQVYAAGAALLRCIVGNPWRSVTLCGPDCADPEEGYHAPVCPLNNPTVLALAQAAYTNRPRRKCERCGGSGVQRGIRPRSNPQAFAECPNCHGSGVIEDGTLDPFRLTLLADALEESGCAEKYLLAHLRGDFVNEAGERVIGANRHLPHARGCWAVDLVLGRM